MTSAPSAAALRAEAAHERKVAAMFPLDADRLPLLDHAEELERQADALDRQAAAETEPDPVEQRQAEQQPQQGEAAAGDVRPLRPKSD